MIYQFTQNGLPPDCHAERSEASVTDSSLTLRMTCSVNMYIITKINAYGKRYIIED